MEGSIGVPRDCVGKVIGSRGSVINGIRRQAEGARIDLDKHDDGSATITVRASEDGINKVFGLLTKALEGEIDTDEDGIMGMDEGTRPRAGPGAPGTAPRGGLPPPTSARGLPPPSAAAQKAGMPRADAEELAEQWGAARRDRDYATADGIRDRLRKAGFEAEDVVEEMAIYGRTERTPAATSAAAHARDLSDISDGKDDWVPDPSFGLIQRPAGWGPTEAAKNHKDGGTGGLLTLNYQQIVPLPKNIGFTVTGGFTTATEEPLLALKRLQEEEEERNRRYIRERNAMAFSGNRKERH